MSQAQQQTLQVCIQQMQKAHENLSGISDRKRVRLMSKIVKNFNQYSKDSQILPPQTLIPCCLFVLPAQFQHLLNLSSGQALEDVPQKKSLQLLLQTYLKGLLKILEKSQDQIKHVIVQGVSKSILLTVAFPKLARRFLKTLIQIWAKQYTNINLGLRAFIALNKYMKVTKDETFMWCLRRIYVSYFQNSKQVSWRNLEHVNFMINCFCELCKLNESRAYYVLFGYIRSIALQMTKLNQTKRKQKVQLTNKLYSNQILNLFKLFTSIISRVNTQQMSALIYPLVELTVAYEKISQASEFIPLKLHLLNCLLTIMQATNVFIPSVIQIFQNLLKNKLFLKKLNKRAEKVGGDLELSFKLSPTDLTNTSLINDTFSSILHKVYWFMSIVSKMAGGSQIIKKIQNLFKRLQFPFSGYKQQVQQLLKITKSDSTSQFLLRASKRVSITPSSIQVIQNQLVNKPFESIIKYQQIRLQRQDLLKKKLLAQNQQKDQDGRKDQQEEQLNQEEDQVNSGWEEPESGASQFIDQHNIDQQHDSDSQSAHQKIQDMQQVSYQGDLDSQQAENAIKQWSEEEWSSQGEI